MVRVRRYKIRGGGGWGVFPLDRWDVQEVISFLQKDSRNTELINRIFQKAIKNKDFLMIQTLLWNRVKIEALNDSNQTAIHLAAAYDYPTIIDRLFRHCNNDVNHTDVNGFTHFHIACISGKTDIVERFLKNGVDVNLRFRAPTHDERNDFTPLHFAVKNARLEVVELLLKRQADANAKDYAGRTPLHHACALQAEPSDGQERTVEIARLLIGYGGDVNGKDHDGDTPLCRLFHGGPASHAEKRPPKHPVDLHASDGLLCKTKRKFIHQLRTRQVQKLRLLLESGAEADARVGRRGDTLLHRAIGDLKASRGFAELGLLCFEDALHAEMVEVILKHAAIDVDAKNDEGETALSIAASLLSADVVAVLLEHSADAQGIKFDAFHHPKTLPCLEAVENLLEIVAMRESRGHHLSQSENLKIIEFFVANNEGCGYANLEDENGSYKLRNLLEFGTDDNVIGSLDKISKHKRCPTGMLSYHVSRYLLKLRSIGLPLSRSVEDYLREKMPSESSEISDRHLKECEAEADKLKSLKLKSNKSLTDLLTSSPVELYSFLKTGEHKQTFNGLDFPHYSGVIQGYLAKCLTRRFVLKAANDYVRCVTATPLPDPCCERISTYLSNEELLHLCSAIEAPTAESAASNESTKAETV